MCAYVHILLFYLTDQDNNRLNRPCQCPIVLNSLRTIGQFLMPITNNRHLPQQFIYSPSTLFLSGTVRFHCLNHMCIIHINLTKPNSNPFQKLYCSPSINHALLFWPKCQTPCRPSIVPTQTHLLQAFPLLV